MWNSCLTNETAVTSSRRKETVRRELSRAVLDYHGIPYLAPEIVLLYKSSEHTKEAYEHDFNLAAPRMKDDQKQWLADALNTCYPDGHPWNSRLKKT